MKILVIQKKMMGDILMSSVLFKQLKKKFPQSVLHFLIGRMGYDVVRENPAISEYIFFDDYDFSKLLKKIRSEKYDYIIDAYSKTGTALLCFLSGVRSVSFRKGYTKYLYSQTIKRTSQNRSPVTTTAIEHRLQLLEPLGISFEEVTPDIFVTTKEKAVVIENLRDAGISSDTKLVMISTFGSNDSKTYPLKYMADVIEQVADFPVKFILNHRRGEEGKIAEVLALLSPKAKDKVVTNLDLNSLRSFICICNECKMLMGNEGGATNISKALGVPTFSIFAPFVSKKGWYWGENGTTNISVHVKDFIVDPEKQNYENFRPELFRETLHQFLATNINA